MEIAVTQTEIIVGIAGDFRRPCEIKGFYRRLHTYNA